VHFTLKEVLTEHFRVHANVCPHRVSVCNKCEKYVQYVKSLSLTESTLSDILWYSVVKRVLCVGLWEGIHWLDQFEETHKIAHWWETFPLSLWWEFRSETWSEKTYWNTALSKVVIWTIQVFWYVTHWHSNTMQQTRNHTSARLLTQPMQIDWSCFIYLCIYFILSYFWMNMCYRRFLCSAVVSHSSCAPTKQQVCSYKAAGVLLQGSRCAPTRQQVCSYKAAGVLLQGSRCAAVCLEIKVH